MRLMNIGKKGSPGTLQHQPPQKQATVVPSTPAVPSTESVKTKIFIYRWQSGHPVPYAVPNMVLVIAASLGEAHDCFRNVEPGHAEYLLEDINKAKEEYSLEINAYPNERESVILFLPDL